MKWCVVQRLDGEGPQLVTERGAWPAGARALPRVSLGGETVNRCASSGGKIGLSLPALFMEHFYQTRCYIEMLSLF